MTKHIVQTYIQIQKLFAKQTIRTPKIYNYFIKKILYTTYYLTFLGSLLGIRALLLNVASINDIKVQFYFLFLFTTFIF